MNLLRRRNVQIVMIHFSLLAVLAKIFHTLQPISTDEPLRAPRFSIATSVGCVLTIDIPQSHRPRPLQLGHIMPHPQE